MIYKNVLSICILLCIQLITTSVFAQSQKRTVKKPIPIAEVDVPPTLYLEKSTGTVMEEKGTFENVRKFFIKNFQTHLGDHKVRKEMKVDLYFVIDKEGKVQDYEAICEDPIFVAEALRVKDKMPKIDPGSKNGEPVNTVYNFPIRFLTKGKSKSSKSRENKKTIKS